MAKGLSNFAVPVANDLAYGEQIIYADFELPNQHIIGATAGGVKVDLERSISEMKYDGSYGPTKGLRRYQKFLAKVTIQGLCLKYNLADLISDMESDGLWESQDWGLNGGTYAASATYREGEQAAQATVDTVNYGIHEVFAASQDFTEFSNGETSSTADKIGFSIYILTADIANLNSGNIEIAFHMDAEGTETNLYKYDVAASALSNGWNSITALKSAFTEVGTGDWSAVTGVSFKIDTAPSAELSFIVDNIYLIQTNSTLRSSIFPVLKNGMDVTDMTTYYKYTPTLSIQKIDFYENIAIVSQKADGKVFAIILKKMLNDGAISAAINEKEEVISSTQFTAHYTISENTTVPVKIRDYDV